MLLRGNVIVEGGEVVAKPGIGQFVARARFGEQLRHARGDRGRRGKLGVLATVAAAAVAAAAVVDVVRRDERRRSAAAETAAEAIEGQDAVVAALADLGVRGVLALSHGRLPADAPLPAGPRRSHDRGELQAGGGRVAGRAARRPLPRGPDRGGLDRERRAASPRSRLHTRLAA